MFLSSKKIQNFLIKLKSKGLLYYFPIPLALWSFYYGLGSYWLANNNEGLYASIGKNMLQTGSYIIPHLNCLPYIEKPPLLYWLLAVSFKLFGFSAFAARFVTASSAFLLCLATLYFGRKIQRAKIARLAVIIFASSIGVIIIARTVYFDMLLTMLVSMSLLSFFYWYQTERKLSLRLAYVFLALAILTKGLVALVLVGGTFGIFLLLEKQFFQTCRKLFDWFGITLFLAIVLPWHIAAALKHPGFAWDYIINEQLLRFLNHRVPHDYYEGHIYYYVPRILIYLFPWSLLLPVIFWPSKSSNVADRSLLRFLWCWLLVPLIFFSLSAAKANYYMIVSMMALALILSIKLNNILESGYRRLIAIWTALILAITAVALLYIYPKIIAQAPLLQAAGYAVLATIVYAVIVLCLILLFYKKDWLIWTGLACLIIPITVTAVIGRQALDDQLSAARMGAYIAMQLPKQPVFLYQDFENISAIAFYANRCFKIIDSKSKDLYYAQHLPDTSGWFLSNEQFIKAVNRAHHLIYVVIPNKRLPVFIKTFSKLPIREQHKIGAEFLFKIYPII